MSVIGRKATFNKLIHSHIFWNFLNLLELSKAQKSFALALYDFKFTEAIGQPTDDELTIGK